MGKKGKVGKNRQDKFYKLAKEQGFRSRASFKLVQLNKRHDFLSSAARGVIDLCAAPGGWMQIARKHMPLAAPCVGIDLVPIKPVGGCVGVVGDITSDKTKGELKRALKGAGNPDGVVDVVLNDGSPNMGKAWIQDAYTQSELTLAALKLASEFLAPGGTFVTKVFRSNDYNSLLFVMNQLFGRVNATKPSASRAESAEIYVMCTKYRAPKSIDPRLLNPKFVFKDLGAAPDDAENEKPDLFLNTVLKEMKKRKRHRGGYEDGDYTLFKRVPILEFLRSERPVALMVETNQFSFDPRDSPEGVGEEKGRHIARALESMPSTSAEVLACCEDLKVLARREFKLMLKWRASARATLSAEGLLHGNAGTDEKDGDEEDEANGSDVEMEEKLVANDESCEKGDELDDEGGESDEDERDLNDEMKKARAEQVAKDKRKKRKANKLRNAIQRKIDMKIILPDDNIDIDNGPQGLFSINSAKRMKKHGLKVTDVPADDSIPAPDDDGYDGDEEQLGTEARLPYKVGDVNAVWDEDNADIEEDLNRWYKVYLSRKKRDKNGVLLQESRERKRITKRRALRDALHKENDEGEDEKEKHELVIDSSESSEEDVVDEEMHVPKSVKSREAALWFSQPLFQNVAGISSDESDGIDDDEVMKHGNEDNDDGMEDEDENGQENFRSAAKREARRMARDSEKKKQEDEDGFEVVPQEKEDDDTDGSDDGIESDSSFHSSDYDTDEKAEMSAIGKRMRQSKKEANSVFDEAYNRYTFDDPYDLPRWFADPDPTYRQRQAPVTKEQVAEMKEYIKNLQAAPTKKEAEAKARRRARTAKKMEVMKTKANSIAEQGDVPASSRMKAIEDLYKQAMKGGKGKKSKRKQYQVVKPNGRMNVGKNSVKGRKAMRGVHTTLVDKRLKADKRGLAKAQRKNKGRK